MQPEEQTYQWNCFIKDFCKDDRSKNYSNKLKVAAYLLSIVMDKPGVKKYSSSLIDKYKNEIDKL